jgi:hypothetical protein
MADVRAADGVRVTRERMQDQDSVGSGLVQLTPRLVGDGDLREAATRLEGKPSPSAVRDHRELAPPRLVTGSPYPWK